MVPNALLFGGQKSHFLILMSIIVSNLTHKTDRFAVVSPHTKTEL